MRYLFQTLESLAASRLVLLAGPRQVGKTTLAMEWAKQGTRSLILNYDIGEDRAFLLASDFVSQIQSRGVDRLLIDEVHKYGRWKLLLKGLVDKKIPGLKTVVTGSARLDLYQRKGDSLFGRYELLRLHPFSLAELEEARNGEIAPAVESLLIHGRKCERSDSLQALETFSGFPEPLFSKDELFLTRWRTRRRELLIQQDLRDLSGIRSLSLVENLYLLLPSRVASPLSINKLRLQLDVSHDTISEWLNYLEKLYILFRVPPFFKKIQRGLKKEQKAYLWDWSQVPEPAARFENLIASHLLKAVHFWSDVGYGDFQLHYLRTKEKEEVDFLIARNGKPWFLVEVKLSETRLSPHLMRFSKELQVPGVQVVRTPGIYEDFGALRLESAETFLLKWL